MRTSVLALTASAILLFTSSIRAQTREVPESVNSENGIKGGLASARFLNSPYETESAMGFVLGVYMDFEVSDNFSVLTEIFYTEKGSKINLPSFDIEFDLNLDYVEVPILANYRIPAESMFQPRIFAGPYAGFLINSSASVSIANGTAPAPEDFVDAANDMEWGAVVGAGVDADLSFRKITLEARYSAGLSDTFHASIAGNHKNGVFSILLGFSL